MTEVLADCQGQELPTGAVVGDIDGNAPAPVAEVPEPAPVQEAPAPAPAPVAPAPVAPEPEPVAPVPVAPEPVAPAPAPAPAAAFANCTAAKAAGAAPLYAGSPGYAPKLDRDGDGVACES